MSSGVWFFLPRLDLVQCTTLSAPNPRWQWHWLRAWEVRSLLPSAACAQTGQRSGSSKAITPISQVKISRPGMQQAHSSFGSPSLGSPVRTPMMMQRWRGLGITLLYLHFFTFDWRIILTLLQFKCSSIFVAFVLCHCLSCVTSSFKFEQLYD